MPNYPELHEMRDAHAALAVLLRERYPQDEEHWGPPLAAVEEELPAECGVHTVPVWREEYSEVPCRPIFFNDDIGFRYGMVPGDCGHAMSAAEWRIGLRKCERCG